MIASKKTWRLTLHSRTKRPPRKEKIPALWSQKDQEKATTCATRMLPNRQHNGIISESRIVSNNLKFMEKDDFC